MKSLAISTFHHFFDIGTEIVIVIYLTYLLSFLFTVFNGCNIAKPET